MNRKIFFLLVVLVAFLGSYNNTYSNPSYTEDSIKGYSFYNKYDSLFYSEPSKAFEYLNKAKKIAIKSNNYKLLLDCRLEEFYTYISSNNNKGALEILHECTSLAKKLKDNLAMADIYNKTGSVYTNIRLYDKALENFKKAYNIYNLLGDKNGLSNTVNNIGVVYYSKGDVVEAYKYMEKSLQFCKILNDKKSVAASLANVAALMLQKGMVYNPIKAKSYLIESEKICQEIKNYEQLAYTQNSLGEFYKTMNKNNDALHYFQKSYLGCDSLNLIDTKILCLKNISDTYVKLNDFEKAFNYFEKATHIEDSIFSIENTKVIAELETKYQSAEKEKENELLKKNNEIHELEIQKQTANISKQRTIIFISIIMVFVLLGFSFILIKNIREKQRKNKQINDQKAQIEDQHKLLAQKNKDTIDSIIYAKRIQDALLKGESIASKKLPDHFIYFQPKDIVSGDFHWIYEQENYWYVAAVDCTGHGVPGAFLTMLGTAYLNEICSNYKNITPADVLNKLREKIIHELNQDGKKTDTKDGMDISLARINLTDYSIDWAGANNPIYYFHNNELNVIKADKQPIGYVENSSPFTNHTIQLNKGDSIYLFTDGYADQFGGPKGKKFKYSQLKEKIIAFQNKPMKEQKQVLEKVFNEWKGDLEQIDDVCIIGIKLT